MVSASMDTLEADLFIQFSDILNASLDSSMVVA